MKKLKKFVTNYKHGGKGTKLYGVWINMRARCNNANHKFFHRYGGRGISICKEWDDFTVFREWSLNNGYKDGMSIDRKNNDGGYSPNNCRFTDHKTQCNNRVNNVFIGGISVNDLAKTKKLSYRKAYHLFNKISGRVKSTNIDKAGMIAIKDAVNNGFRVTDVAKYFNKSNSNISGHLRKIGVKRQRCYAPNSKINKETSDKIRKEIESGVSVSEIIIKYKISSSSVYNIKNNITWNNN